MALVFVSQHCRRRAWRETDLDHDEARTAGVGAPVVDRVLVVRDIKALDAGGALAALGRGGGEAGEAGEGERSELHVPRGIAVEVCGAVETLAGDDAVFMLLPMKPFARPSCIHENIPYTPSYTHSKAQHVLVFINNNGRRSLPS